MSTLGDIRGYGPKNTNKEKKYLEIGALVHPEEAELEICGVSENESSIFEASLIIEDRLPKEQVLSVIDALQNWAENYLCGRCLCTDGNHHPLCKTERLPDQVVEAFSAWENMPDDLVKVISEWGGNNPAESIEDKQPF